MKKIGVEYKVLALVLLVMLPLAYFSLSHVPSLYIDSVILSMGEEDLATPYGLKSSLSQYSGKSLVSLSLRRVRRDLEKLPLVEEVILRKKFPSTLLVEAKLVDTAAVVLAKDADDETVAVYVLRPPSLLPLQQEDWTLFGERVLKVEIPHGYATLMEKYGMDASFAQVMELAASLEENRALITRIKYDNNSSNSFGKMILELSALHAQIWVREPVSQEQVSQAIHLVQEDQRESLSFLREHMMRYDLYKGAMVRRK